jgi:hypothetical protein
LFWRWQKVPMQLMQTVCCSEWATLGPCNPEQNRRSINIFTRTYLLANGWSQEQSFLSFSQKLFKLCNMTGKVEL